MRPTKAERSPARASAHETTETTTTRSMMKPGHTPVKRARLPFPFGDMRRLAKQPSLLAVFLGAPVYEEPIGRWGNR